ncbi:DUF4097 family beta strand repeat-containing protein [Halomicrobium salinisoli]|uniref:DUF4097 family beta strand repeat-containing protein n=1 Tax=Halomicrobium salinisoli TaxID=2878391 RepID=UPI001CF000D7|nr:DUF4097 family beta strand repeat-containing protein [Halomicrobium salinisoli]
MEYHTRRSVLAGLAATTALSGCVAAGGSRTVEETETTTHDAGEALAVDGEAGDVTVEGADRDDVEVQATKRAASEGDLGDVSLSTDRSDGRLELVVEREDAWFRFGSPPRLDLHVTVPADVRVERIDVASGDVELTGVRGPTTVDTSSGDVRARDVDGDVTVDTSSGDVTLQSVGVATVDVSSGDVEVIDADGNVTADTSSGDVTVANPGGDVDVSASSGDVSIRLPAEPGATVSADVTSGDIETTGLDVSTDGSTLETTVGDGSRTVDVSTSSGDVEIVVESD